VRRQYRERTQPWRVYNTAMICVRVFTEGSLHAFWARSAGAVVLRDKAEWAKTRALGRHSASNNSRALCARLCVLAMPPCPPHSVVAHSSPHPQIGPPDSPTSPVIVLYSHDLCDSARLCVLAMYMKV
jgi:hypothetical protein